MVDRERYLEILKKNPDHERKFIELGTYGYCAERFGKSVDSTFGSIDNKLPKAAELIFENSEKRIKGKAKITILYDPDFPIIPYKIEPIP